ncbi:UNVERIFIED_CONTAM: hypothetical protein FKN15_056966 [Acipenser sinensis]
MERAENGAALLALSVDVNKNEQKSTSYSRLTGCKSGKPALLLNENKKPAFKEDTNSVLSGKGYVYIASGTNVNEDKAALAGKKKLYCVSDSECLHSVVKDSCVITERCSDGTVNGFTEASEQLMVGSEAAGVGCKGTPSCFSNCTADKQVKKRNGMLINAAPDGVECGRKDDGVSEKQDNGLLNPKIGAKTVLPLSGSCDGKHQLNCTGSVGPANMKLTNGDVDCVKGDIYPSCSEDVSSFGCDSSVYKPSGALFEKEVKLVNGGLLIVNKCALLNDKLDLRNSTAECIGETAAVSDMQIKKLIFEPALEDGFNKGFCPEDDDFGTTGVGPAETTAVGECCDLIPNITTTVSGTLDIENMGPKDETFHPNESNVKEDDESEESNPSPLELRTNPSSRLSISCEATPDSPGNSEVSFGTEAVDDTNDVRFMDVNLSSRNTFEVNRRQSAPDHVSDGLTLAADPSSHQELKPQKLGIIDFFSRSLFSRKTKDPKPPSQSASGWKLFGKVPLRENPQKDSLTIQQEYEARTGKTANLPPQSGRRKNLEFEPLSTTALILEDRPANLPAKSAEEALRHRHEYDSMVAEAKKREMKDAHKKKKIMKERYKQEEVIANAMVIWNSEILPNWEAMRSTRKVREFWWQGLPPSVRGKVWSLAVGNELNITHELYEIFLSRAKERWKSFSETGSENEAEDSGASGADRESSLDLIKLDISRTFPSLFIFQKGGPYHDLLHSVLGAYTCYRPDVGYVQGMSFIAAVLILNLEEADAFILFANLLNKPCQMAFFRVDHDLMLKYFAAFEVFFEENLPRLFVHFKTYNLTPDIYLIDWIFTLYSKSLPLDLACRVWDVFCRDGEEFLFRTGLGILKLYEDILLQMDFIHIAQFLTKLPEDITSEKLFNCIAAVQMLSSNKKWTQRKSKKKAPSFRKLLKTSNIKIENKLKNRQFKQQSIAKKHRKEQKKLKQALSNAATRTPLPLERYKKRHEEEEEEFEETLPVDMMEDDDLEQMKAMAQRASFLTRDLSSSEPVHARKRKQENMMDKFEKVPRLMQKEQEKELIHLLPIKDKTGIIPQTMEKPVVKKAEKDNEDEDGGDGAEEVNAPKPLPLLTTQELVVLRRKRLEERKVCIAALGSSILSAPSANVSDVLNIDPLKFYTHLYKTLLRLHAGTANDDMIIVLQCLDVMLTKRRKQVSVQRALAFIKRLTTLSLQVLPNSTIGILATNRVLMHTFPKSDILLDNESQGSGIYLPELDEPEYCNPQNTSLWELHTLQRHYHPIVRKFAAHLIVGAPSEGSGALNVDLSRKSATDLFEDYSIKGMTFNPPVATPSSKKKVKKETQQLREFEEGLVSQYKFYLENLEQTVKDWKQMKKKKSDVVSLKSYNGLAEVAVKCLCELLVALPHFNFHNNIIVMIVPLMNHDCKKISEMSCEAVRKLFKQDKVGQASLGMVKVISGLVKSRNYEVKPEAINIGSNVLYGKDADDIAPKKRFMNFKEKRKHLSRMQRKHTETLNIVFLTYFRILKKAQKSILLPCVLEGLAKFAHLINVEFFDDLLIVLHKLVESGDLSYRESLHCIQTAFHVLSGQGDVLNIDPLKFYMHLYKTLLRLHAGTVNDDMIIVLQCLDVMLTKRRKQVSVQRALAFIK